MVERQELEVLLKLRDDMSAALARANRNVQSFDRSVAMAGGQMDSRLGRTLDSVGRKLGSFSSNLNRAVGRIGTGLQRAGDNIQRTSLLLGGIAVGAGAQAVKWAVEWESGIAGINKTMEVTPQELASIDKQLRGLTSTLPVAGRDLLTIAENAGSLGIAKKDVVEFTRIISMMAATTDLTADAASMAFGHIAAVTGLSGKQFEMLGATIVDLGNKLATTEAPIVNIMERMAGMAKVAGLSTPAMAGWAAAASSIGMRPELAGGNLQRFFAAANAAIAKGGPALQSFAKVAGMTVRDFRKLFEQDASEALRRFVVGLNGQGRNAQKILEDLFGKTTGMRQLLLGLAQAHEKVLTPALNTANESWKEANALQAEFDKRAATSASQFMILKNNIQLAGITIGEALLPKLVELAKRFTEFLRNNPEKVQDFAKKLGGALDTAVRIGERIDWGGIASALGHGARFAGLLMEAFSHAPGWLQTAVVTGWGLNKLTGGMVGGIVADLGRGIAGGTIGALTKRMFDRGSSPANPMYVRDISARLLDNSGALPAGGGRSGGMLGRVGSILGKVIVVGEIIALTTAVVSELQDIAEQGRQPIREGIAGIAGKTPEVAIKDFRGFIDTMHELQGGWRMLADTVAGKEQIDALLAFGDRLVAVADKMSPQEMAAAIGELIRAKEEARARGNEDAVNRLEANIQELRRKMKPLKPADIEDGVRPPVKGLASVLGRHLARQGRLTDQMKADIRRGNARNARLLEQIRAKPTIVNTTVSVSTKVTTQDIETSTKKTARYGMVAS